ncbi:tail-specific protease [Neptunitalea sp. Y10]|uniref:Tail-specific protease n=1 Tax=Neptunitalea lumnitzerae TaxID=2965509 RepID=A0ABQ5ML32_9FLAO|nr:tail-specific protease [Neptunitalea sp. Y10]
MKGFSQTDDFCETLSSVNSIIQKYHYAPKAVDDSLSAYVFHNFLEKLDEDEMYFLKEDFEKLNSYFEYNLDDAILNNNCSFIDTFYTIYKIRLDETKKVLEEIDIQQLDFSGTDSLYFTKRGTGYRFAKTKEKKATYWSRKIRRDAIYKFLDLTDSTETFNTKINTVTKQVIDNEICIIEDKLKTDHNLKKTMQDAFLDTFCSYFDPHTNYFNPSDKSYFDESLHDDYNSIGLKFSKTDNGNIVVSEIQAGCTAWKENLVEIGDEILTITANNIPLEMNCISLETLYNFIYNPENKILHFRIKKKSSNTTTTINLKKEAIHIADNTVDSFILKGTNKVGYIKLPGFYTSEDFGMGCANDIAKELLRLNKEKVEALILDLRNNGGGSLKEATDLVGLFIDRGPVAIVNTRENNKEIVKDYNRGTVFSKPLIILVNENSASASEYVTASLQDHQRAIVVGTTTFGKASGQTIFTANPNNPNAGYVKVTFERLYRITGESWQKDGVVPDFSIPSLLESFSYRESHYENVLANDTIVKNTYFKIPVKRNLQRLIEQSKERLEISKNIQLIKKIDTDLHTYFDDTTTIPLSLKGVISRKEKFDAIWTQMDSVYTTDNSFKIDNTLANKEIISKNDEVNEINTKKREDLLKDYELSETYKIITDLLTNK